MFSTTNTFKAPVMFQWPIMKLMETQAEGFRNQTVWSTDNQEQNLQYFTVLVTHLFMCFLTVPQTFSLASSFQISSGFS